MKMRAIWIGLGVALLCLPGQAQDLKPHTEFRVKLTGPLSTQTNRKGDRLAAQVLTPKAFAGATVEGEITDCNSKGILHRKAMLRIMFRTLHTKQSAIFIASDIKLIVSAKGVSNSDEAGAGIEHSSELPASADAAIVVQMSTTEKQITFAPGTVFVLDVSQLGAAR